MAEFAALAVGQSLADTFTYTVSDPSGATATATVTVTVYATATQAVALDDVAATDEDTTLTGNVLGNDQIASAGLTIAVTTTSTTSAQGVAVAINAAGEISPTTRQASPPCKRLPPVKQSPTRSATP